MLQMRILGLKPSSRTYNGYVRALISVKTFHDGMEVDKPERAIRVWAKVKNKNLMPDIRTYELLFSLFPYDVPNIMSQADAATRIKAIEMDMMRHGIQHSLFSLQNLILSKCEAFGEAFRLLDRASSEAIVPNVLLYNAILKIASQKGRIDVIELIVEKMHRLKIQLNPSTCRHVFSAYFVNGFQSTTLEALQVMSLRMISERADILEEYRLKYENIILDEEREAASEIMKLFKDSPFLVVALLNLRWCAILV